MPDKTIEMLDSKFNLLERQFRDVMSQLEKRLERIEKKIDSRRPFCSEHEAIKQQVKLNSRLIWFLVTIIFVASARFVANVASKFF